MLSILQIKQFILLKTANMIPVHLHYHIAISVSDNTFVLLAMITSQGEKRKDYYKHKKKALQSVVDIENLDAIISQEIIIKIKEGIQNSPIVKPVIKKAKI